MHNTCNSGHAMRGRYYNFTQDLNQDKWDGRDYRDGEIDLKVYTYFN